MSAAGASDGGCLRQCVRRLVGAHGADGGEAHLEVDGVAELGGGKKENAGTHVARGADGGPGHGGAVTAAAVVGAGDDAHEVGDVAVDGGAGGGDGLALDVADEDGDVGVAGGGGRGDVAVAGTADGIEVLEGRV